MKYKTYWDLIRAYGVGELDRDTDIVYFDNDDAYLEKDGEIVFKGNGYEDLVTLAKVAGIPAEWV